MLFALSHVYSVAREIEEEEIVREGGPKKSRLKRGRLGTVMKGLRERGFSWLTILSFLLPLILKWFSDGQNRSDEEIIELAAEAAVVSGHSPVR
jgi:hypothetical protein